MGQRRQQAEGRNDANQENRQNGQPGPGIAAVAVRNGKAAFQSRFPVFGSTETRPDCVKKITWRTPRIVARTGVA